MKIEIVEKNRMAVAVVHSEEVLVTSASSALELIMSVKYETGCANIALNKEALCEDFFILSTCLAGEILQKLWSAARGVRRFLPLHQQAPARLHV